MGLGFKLLLNFIIFFIIAISDVYSLWKVYMLIIETDHVPDWQIISFEFTTKLALCSLLKVMDEATGTTPFLSWDFGSVHNLFSDKWPVGRLLFCD